MKSVKFLGYVFTQDGLKKLWKKQNHQNQIKLSDHFLVGMVVWNQRFIERFSEMSAVLYDLVNEKGSFKWKDEHQQAFDAIKKSLTKETMLRYFEKSRETAVFVDVVKKAHKMGD